MSGRRQSNDPHPRGDQPQNRINEQIRAREVRVVGDNVEQGIYTIREARDMAREQQLDLVEISPQADPPVCKILDYRKFLYQQKKRAKEQKANQAKSSLKEIRFGPQTDDHDYNFKLKHAISFLQEGSKVRAYVFFRGRSIVFKDQGKLLLLRFANDLEDYARVDQMPKLEGKRMSMLFSPKKGVAKKKTDGGHNTGNHGDVHNASTRPETPADTADETEDESEA